MGIAAVTPIYTTAERLQIQIICVLCGYPTRWVGNGQRGSAGGAEPCLTAGKPLWGAACGKCTTVICASKRYNNVRHLRSRTDVKHLTSAGYAGASPAVKHGLPSMMACHPYVNHKPGGRVCNRAAVVDGGGGCVPHIVGCRRQCGVIEVVTAPRLIPSSDANVGAYGIRPYRRLVAEDDM